MPTQQIRRWHSLQRLVQDFFTGGLNLQWEIYLLILPYYLLIFQIFWKFSTKMKWFCLKGGSLPSGSATGYSYKRDPKSQIEQEYEPCCTYHIVEQAATRVFLCMYWTTLLQRRFRRYRRVRASATQIKDKDKEALFNVAYLKQTT